MCSYELLFMTSIVIYFSRAGSNWVKDGVGHLDVGNTELLAKYIQKKTGSDIFKIETTKQYPDDYYQATEVAKEELQNGFRPKLIKYPDNLEKYDKIYLGHPIWWSTFPTAVFTLLEKCNLDGKMIIPFCTHEGSGIANSDRDLKQICGNSKIKSYFEIRGYMCQEIDTNANLQNKINAWIEKNDQF